MAGRVAVLGAGLLGACVAMDLADSGCSVDLYDRASEPMTRASLQNEGKIHLGYIYAKDPTLRTARTMVDGAATFGPLLQRWLGVPMSAFAPSNRFRYAVHRDSQLTADEFERHLRSAHELATQRIRNGDYFGVDLGRLPRRMSEVELLEDYDSRTVAAAFETPEISIDPRRLADAVRARLSIDSHIRVVMDTEVRSVASATGGLTVTFELDGTIGSDRYHHVVNALWDGRLAVDATAALVPERSWLFRVKHYITLSTSAPARLPSTTVVLGPFGDIVDYGDGTYYLSWYPSGMVARSSGIDAPSSQLSDEERAAVRRGIADGLGSIVPGLADVPSNDLDDSRVRGGVIFAWGATDIDDTASGLHERFATGPMTVGRYHTVDTGKLTTAPLYARAVADRIRADP